MFATQHQRSLTCASSHAMLWADTPQRIPRLLIAERSAGMAHVRALEGICLLVVTFILATGCGPSEEERTKETNRLIAAALTAIPSPTPIQFPTPLPTSTPMPTATPQKVIDLSKVYNQSWPAVFYIDANDRYGSGWLLEPGFILTAFHVIRTNYTPTIRTSGSQPFTGKVVAFDRERDIALISFDSKVAGLPSYAVPLPLGNIGLADIASPLLALGYSDSGLKADGSVGSAAPNVGYLSQIVGTTTRYTGLNMDIAVAPGDSGGPVLDGNGFVVGMIRATAESGIGNAYAIHVDVIRAALPTLKRGKSQ
ncbi:MAG: serine protease [Dehalococcoidia bacterium]|nr:serine protease [Dehalococcoidia bacterium]